MTKCAGIGPCCRKPFWPVPARRSATRRRRGAICVSGRAAVTSTTRLLPATSASPTLAAMLCGVNRNHAILGTSEACIATYPGDMAVALVALEAVVTIEGPAGKRRVAMSEFHRLPGDDASRDNVLAAGEVITAVTLPAPLGGRHIYRKVRDRSSYAFALVSVACVVVMDGDRIGRARLAFGGVAHKPWRDTEAEKMLEGARPSPALFNRAADVILKDAQGFGANDFKILLVRRTLCAVLNEATKG